MHGGDRVRMSAPAPAPRAAGEVVLGDLSSGRCASPSVRLWGEATTSHPCSALLHLGNCTRELGPGPQEGCCAHGEARGRWVLPGPGAAQPPRGAQAQGGAGFWLCSAPLQKQPLGTGSSITSQGVWGRQSPRHRPCSCTPPPHPGAVPFPARAQLCFQPDVRPQDETALPAPAPAVALSGSRSGGWIRPRRLNKALPLSGSPRRASPYLAQPPCQDHEAAGRTRRAGRGRAGASRGR